MSPTLDCRGGGLTTSRVVSVGLPARWTFPHLVRGWHGVVRDRSPGSELEPQILATYPPVPRPGSFGLPMTPRLGTPLGQRQHVGSASTGGTNGALIRRQETVRVDEGLELPRRCRVRAPKQSLGAMSAPGGQAADAARCSRIRTSIGHPRSEHQAWRSSPVRDGQIRSIFGVR